MTDKTTIIPERLHRLLGEDFHLRSGSGSGINGEVDACIMQAVDWLAGGTGKVAPSITRFCIRLNDSWLFAEHRDLLKPFAAKIVGTRNPSLDRKRDFICAAYAASEFAAYVAYVASDSAASDSAARKAGICDLLRQKNLECLQALIDA